MAHPIPTSEEQITLDWLNGLLGPAGWPRISGAHLEPLSDFNPHITRIFRAHLTFARGETGAAPSIIVKVPSGGPVSVSDAVNDHLYEREIGTYGLLADYQGRCLPRLYASDFDAGTAFGALLIEDLAGPYSTGITPDSIHPVVSAIAEIHARFWQDTRLSKVPWIRKQKRTDLWGDPPDSYPEAWNLFCLRHSPQLRIRKTGDLLAKRLPAVLAELEDRPPTLIHQDLHDGNLMFRGTSRAPVFIDWQGTTFAGSASDLAKLLLHVPAGWLKEREAGILQHYHGCLLKGGVLTYSLQRLVRDYRLAQLATLANYVIGQKSEGGNQATDFDISTGVSLRSVASAVEAVFPEAFEWP